MNNRRALPWLGTATLFLGLFTPLSTLAQQDTPQQEPTVPSTQNPAQNSGADSQGEQQTQTFSGRIVKSKGNFMLKDQATHSAYQLDNGDQAKQYLGKHVKVTGTLDPAANMIHVSNIDVASASN